MAAQRSFPRRTLEQALRVPTAIKEKNGGNPWQTGEVATALVIAPKSANFFYITAASRDYGLTKGTRDTAEISLTDLGRRAVFPASEAERRSAYLDAFLNVDLFRGILSHYGGSALPERTFLENTLLVSFGVPGEHVDEFVDTFAKNCRFLGIGAKFTPGERHRSPGSPHSSSDDGAVTVGAPDNADDAPILFVIMPFTERQDVHETGFFDEVLTQLFTPAGKGAGFKVKTAQRHGSDVIQSTIVNDLLEADLVLADLTEHNPNVLFELGMRMHEDRPVVLVRARGTGPIFDVDNMLRVQEYDPRLWPSTVALDLPELTAHISGAWEGRETAQTFMKILRPQTNA